MEVEYKAVANIATEVLWLKTLLRDLGVPIMATPILWCDNIGATYLSVNIVFHARTKHVEIDFHFVHDQVAHKTIQIQFIPSKEQLANILTKPIVATCSQYFITKLNVASPPLRLQGDVKPPTLSAIQTIQDKSDQENDSILDKR
jgi:hypothetical protein